MALLGVWDHFGTTWATKLKKQKYVRLLIMVEGPHEKKEKVPLDLRKQVRAGMISLPARTEFLVAGTGFEPVTSGL